MKKKVVFPIFLLADADMNLLKQKQLNFQWRKTAISITLIINCNQSNFAKKNLYEIELLTTPEKTIKELWNDEIKQCFNSIINKKNIDEYSTVRLTMNIL